jgi:hypothetical protein
VTITVKQLEAVYGDLENQDYNIYFYVPDFDKPSGGVGLTYDHVRILNENGFNANVLHTKKDFKPEWLGERGENIPIVYLEEKKLELRMQDFVFIPEGFPQVMENLHKQKAACKKIVFCQNWYYVLNSLQPGQFWNQFGINECMSVSNIQTEYLKAIMPFLRCKQVVGSIDNDKFFPPENLEDKKPVVSFVNNRDPMKAHNVIKTFYAIFPHFRWIQFNELKDLSNEDYSAAIRESAFYIHFDEVSSWGTAPIEAYLSKTLVAGWDGVGGKEYMTNDNIWLAPNGDIFRLAIAIGQMIETWLLGEVKDETWSAMEKATLMYTKEEEKDSIVKAHTEYRDERMEEIERFKTLVSEQEKTNE